MELIHETIAREVMSLKAHALSFVHTNESAEDLIQSTYLRAHQHADKFRGGNLRAWLKTVMRNTYLNSIRRGKYNRYSTKQFIFNMSDFERPMDDVEEFDGDAFIHAEWLLNQRGQ